MDSPRPHPNHYSLPRSLTSQTAGDSRNPIASGICIDGCPRVCGGEYRGKTLAKFGVYCDEVFEFWQSDVHCMFRLAAMPRHRPPEGQFAHQPATLQGLSPFIKLLLSDAVDQLRTVRGAVDGLQLNATADADVLNVYRLDDRVSSAPVGPVLHCAVAEIRSW